MYIRTVPDFSGSQRQSDSWITQGSPDSVLSSFKAAIVGRRGRITVDDPGGFSFDMGSRTNYRLMGMWSRPLSRPLIGTVSVRAVEGSGPVEINVELASNEGAALAEVTSLVSRQFARTFNSLLEVLRRAAPPSDD
jgi:hypothetical protein